MDHVLEHRHAGFDEEVRGDERISNEESADREMGLSLRPNPPVKARRDSGERVWRPWGCGLNADPVRLIPVPG
jgi:hypothetical protein